MRLRYALLMMVATLLICAAFSAPAPAYSAPTEFVTNGALQDADFDGLPDGWQLIPFSKLDTLNCVGITRGECWYQFNSVNYHRGIRQMVIPIVLTPLEAVTFSFRGKGLLTDSGAAGAIYVYTGGQFPVFSKFILLPVGVAFDQTFTVTFAIPANTTGFQVDFTAARAGVWSFTDVSVKEAVLRRR